MQSAKNNAVSIFFMFLFVFRISSGYDNNKAYGNHILLW